jgi:two-component system, NarL family, response regulator NreC
MENKTVNLLIVDDHAPIIEGYKAILFYNKSGVTVTTKEANDCETAYKIIVNSGNSTLFDVVFIDVTLPPYIEKNIQSGEDLVPFIRENFPTAKIVILTSHTESLVLFRILDNCNPEGLLVKSDFSSEELIVAFDTILNDEKYYTKTVHKHIKEVKDNVKILDNYNRQIILLLSQGIKTKNLHEHLHLSVSAIDKRKVAIKHYFGIEKGTDEDIIREARNQGLI